MIGSIVLYKALYGVIVDVRQPADNHLNYCPNCGAEVIK